MSTNLTNHISEQFDNELEDIRARVLAMGGLVEEHLNKAIYALQHGDTDLAAEISASDYKVNNMEVSIDEECTQILARRQPAAVDLRLVMAVSKTITDLERIGDEAEKIARMCLRLIDSNISKKYYVGVINIGRLVQGMLHQSLDTFARMDSAEAMRNVLEDEKVDNEHDAVMRQLITHMMEDPRDIKIVLDAVWSVRALERIGDHIINIYENVIYFVEGRDVRHISPEQIQRELTEKSNNEY